MMSRHPRLRATALVSLFALASLAPGLAAEPVGPELTPKLRSLLIKEMVQIEQAMQAIFSAIVRGQHATIAEKGQAIHDSFILKQSLTEEDRQDLKAAVPAEFLQMDAHLHELSASLAEAGRSEDTLQQIELFGRMADTCVACHSTYTADRFPGLEAPAVPEDWEISSGEPGDKHESH